MPRNGLRNVGLLWNKVKGKGKDKREFMSGVLSLGALGEINIMVFPNDKKEADNQPDWNICISTDNGE